jgi:hypothetical protein
MANSTKNFNFTPKLSTNPNKSKLLSETFSLNLFYSALSAMKIST